MSRRHLINSSDVFVIKGFTVEELPVLEEQPILEELPVLEELTVLEELPGLEELHMY